MRRIEVITGDAGRRSHPEGFKGRLVALTLVRDACIADIAKAHGIHPQLLYTWRRQAKAGKLALPAAEMPDFAPVVIEDDRSPPVPEAPAAPAGIEVEVGGVTVRLPGDVDIDRLAMIVAALREAR